jgi:hypothetical protein
MGLETPVSIPRQSADKVTQTEKLEESSDCMTTPVQIRPVTGEVEDMDNWFLKLAEEKGITCMSNP